MTSITNFLKNNQSFTNDIWKAEAATRREAFFWQRYSFGIAAQVRSRMKELGMTQNALAEKLGCTQQYISILLKGKENLTLETIAKLEMALRLDFLGGCIPTSPSYEVKERTRVYLNSNNEVPPYGDKQ